MPECFVLCGSDSVRRMVTPLPPLVLLICLAPLSFSGLKTVQLIHYPKS
jgi:hypothetical protein